MTKAITPSKSSKRTVYLSDKVWKIAVAAGKELNMSTSKVLAALVLEAAHLLTPPTIKGLVGHPTGEDQVWSSKQATNKNKHK
jgi:hypothetical protein